MLLFCAHLSETLSRAAGTVKDKLMGIRHTHVINGMGDPLTGKPRLSMLLKALKKIAKVIRRFPVTVEMPEAIYARLDMNNPDHAVLWTAVVVAFLFLLRCGEYLCHDGQDFLGYALTGNDVSFWLEGNAISIGKRAEEVSIRLRSSKADTFNAGQSRSHFRSGKGICAFEMLARMQALFPERFYGGAEAHKPLFRKSGGSPIFRSEVQEIIQSAAEVAKVPKERLATHSLRIGGASALLHAGFSVRMIQRWGRWAGDAFRNRLKMLAASPQRWQAARRP